MKPANREIKLAGQIKALRRELVDLENVYNAYEVNHNPAEAKALRGYIQAKAEKLQELKLQYQSTLEDIRLESYLKQLVK